MSSVKNTLNKIRKILSPRRRNSVPIVDTPSRFSEPEVRRNEILIYRKNTRELRATKQRIDRDPDSPRRARRRIALDLNPEKPNRIRSRSVSLGETSTIPSTSDSEIVRRANLAATTAYTVFHQDPTFQINRTIPNMIPPNPKQPQPKRTLQFVRKSQSFRRLFKIRQRI